jgi:hypothetical protein
MTRVLAQAVLDISAAHVVDVVHVSHVDVPPCN